MFRLSDLKFYILPIGYLAAAIFLLASMLYAGGAGALLAITVISAVRLAYAFFVWHG